jgi:hypothetical protein
MNITGNNFFKQNSKNIILPTNPRENIRSSSSNGNNIIKIINTPKIYKANKLCLKANEFFPKYSCRNKENDYVL